MTLSNWAPGFLWHVDRHDDFGFTPPYVAFVWDPLSGMTFLQHLSAQLLRIAIIFS